MRRSSVWLLAGVAFLTLGTDECPPPRDTIITVETTVPGIVADGICSLAEAIENANAGEVHGDCEPGSAGRNRVVLGPELTYTLTVPFDGGYGLPEISGNVLIFGRKSVIERAEDSPEFGILRSSNRLELDHVTLRNAAGNAAVATSNRLVIRGSKIESSDFGIAMLGSARLEIFSSTIRGNGTGLVNTCPANPENRQSVSIDGTTFSSNRPHGAIAFDACTEDSSLNVINSTFSANAAPRGGAISVTHGWVYINFSTIVGNVGYNEGGGISATNTDLYVNNTIVAQNEGLNCSITNHSTVSSSHNISDDDWCQFDDETDLRVDDPMLSELAYWGGPTLTRMPLEGSPAIDSAVTSWPAVRDQRYYRRPADGDGDGIPRADCGAVEVGAAFGYPPRIPPQQHLHWGIIVDKLPTPPSG